ncbi:hypothetical protein J6590_007481 [Homalodisca vitripennis]|nr:hypothetical protein J6590_007481 [Homalodisca vitripennis]
MTRRTLDRTGGGAVVPPEASNEKEAIRNRIRDGRLLEEVAEWGATGLVVGSDWVSWVTQCRRRQSIMCQLDIRKLCRPLYNLLVQLAK